MEGSVAPLRGFAFGLLLLHGLLPCWRLPSEPLQPIGQLYVHVYVDVYVHVCGHVHVYVHVYVCPTLCPEA